MSMFKPGDVINLKVGGPLMTVEAMRQDGLVCAAWFDVEGHLQRDSFDPVSVQQWKAVDADPS